MNTPITAQSKALADEGRYAAEELVNAKNAIIAELARVSSENIRLLDFAGQVSRAYMARGDWAVLKEMAKELLAAHQEA